jgi:hypothetical protein
MIKTILGMLRKIIDNRGFYAASAGRKKHIFFGKSLRLRVPLNGTGKIYNILYRQL